MNYVKIVTVLAASLGLASLAAADLTNTVDTDANSLGAALTAGSSGLTFNSFSLYGRTDGNAASSGTYASTGDPMGLGGTSGIVLSSGNVADYSTGPNTAGDYVTEYDPSGGSVAPDPSWETAMDDIDNNTGVYDDTYFSVSFTTGSLIESISFNFVFASEEFSEWVGTEYTDVFGAFLVEDTGGVPTLSDSDNISFDDNGLSIQINSDFLPRTDPTGTEADEALPYLKTTATVSANTDYMLVFGIDDQGDADYDSTVWINGLTGGGQGNPGTDPVVPAPGAALLGVIGLSCVSSLKRRLLS